MVLINRKDIPEPNTTCEICGRRYRLCVKCAQMRTRGIEAWRQHCDSEECYLTYILVNMMGLDEITKEQYERAVSAELPDGRDYVPDVQAKMDKIAEHLGIKTAEKIGTQTIKSQSVKSTNEQSTFKKYDHGYNKKKNNNTNTKYPYSKS